MDKTLKAFIQNVTLDMFGTSSMFVNVDEKNSLDLTLYSTNRTRIQAYMGLIQKECETVKFNYAYLRDFPSDILTGFKISFTDKETGASE